MAEPDIDEVMTAYAADAVVFAKTNFDLTLDFSEESVEKLETIAETLYQSRPKGFWSKLFRTGPSSDDVQTVCKMLGGYLGEVLRRRKGGAWALHEELNVVGLRRGESWLFPPDKVHRRLTYGDDENLWIYFRIVLAEPWEKKSARGRAGSVTAAEVAALHARDARERPTHVPSTGR